MKTQVCNNMTLDWLGFTYRNESLAADQDLFYDGFVKDFPELEEMFGEMTIYCKVLDDGSVSPDIRKFLNYDFCMGNSNNVFIRYDEDLDSVKGLNVQIPSHYISHFMELLHVSSVKMLFRILSCKGCVPSRIDIAFDDYQKRFRPYQYMKWFIGMRELDDVRMDTRFRKADLIYDGSGKKGDTFYVGTRGKDRYLRIYDKDLESCGEIDAVRYEFEFHYRGARSIWNEVIEKDGLNFRSLLCSFFTIRDGSNTKNQDVSQWKYYAAWDQWLESQLYFIVDVPKLDFTSTQKSKYRHIMLNVVPQIARLLRHGDKLLVRDFWDHMLSYKEKSADLNRIDLLNKYYRKEVLKC